MESFPYLSGDQKLSQLVSIPPYIYAPLVSRRKSSSPLPSRGIFPFDFSRLRPKFLYRGRDSILSILHTLPPPPKFDRGRGRGIKQRRSRHSYCSKDIWYDRRMYNSGVGKNRWKISMSYGTVLKLINDFNFYRGYWSFNINMNMIIGKDSLSLIFSQSSYPQFQDSKILIISHSNYKQSRKWWTNSFPLQCFICRIVFCSTFDQRAILISSSSEDPNDYSSDRLFGGKRRDKKREKGSRRGRDKRIAVSVPLFSGWFTWRYWQWEEGYRFCEGGGGGCVQPPYSGVAVTSLVKTP